MTAICKVCGAECDDLDDQYDHLEYHQREHTDKGYGSTSEMFER